MSETLLQIELLNGERIYAHVEYQPANEFCIFEYGEISAVLSMARQQGYLAIDPIGRVKTTCGMGGSCDEYSAIPWSSIKRINKTRSPKGRCR